MNVSTAKKERDVREGIGIVNETVRGFGVLEKGKVGWMEKAAPECGEEDVIVKPIVIAPCSSDVHSAYEIDSPFLNNLILGHECVGEIIEAGSKVRDFKVGDRVVIPCTTPTWKHPDVQDSVHQHAGGLNTAINFSQYEDGTFADRVKVRSADMNLALLPDDMAPETAVMITDMMTTGFHGPELAEVKFGDTVVVFGIGPVGLMAVAGSKLMGAAKMIAVGTRPNCIEVAKEYGATDIVSYKEGDVYQQIMDLTNGQGADAVILCGGDTKTIDTAIAVTKNGGYMANLNVITDAPTFDVSMASMAAFMGHKTIRGGLCPGGRKRMERLIAVVQAGRVDPSKMITHRFHGLDSLEEAFELMVDKPKDLIKPVVFVD